MVKQKRNTGDKTIKREENLPIRIKSKTIVAIAFFEGFSVLAVELLGAKILNSYFGSMLLVWTLVLSVTLVSLAIGYYIGGRIAAKNQGLKISRSLYICAYSICFSLLISNYLFTSMPDYGFYFGLIASSFIILFPPLVCLGSISPLLIQSHAKSIDSSGYSAGTIYAISTFGGVLGAFVLGFFVIEKFGITYPLLAVAFTLLFMSLFVTKKKLITSLMYVGIFAALAFFPIKKMGKKKSSQFEVVYESEGIQGQLKVLDFYPPGQNFSTRRLLINGISQTYIINAPEAYSFWNYTHVLNAFSSLKENSASTLLLGLGGGTVARELQERGVKFDAVELDKRIIELAPKYFYLKKEGINIFNDDARHYINRTKKKYDVVIYDVLSGEVRSNYVYTKESLKELKKRLNPGAIVIVNYQGIVHGTKDSAFPSLYRTFEEAGFNVYYWASEPNSFNDIVFVLSEEKIDFSKIDPSRLNICCKTNPKMKSFFKSPVVNHNHNFADFEVLEDDKPRLEFLSRQVMFEWRSTINNDITEKELEQGISLYK